MGQTFTGISYALMRVAIGFIFFLHGSQKIFNLPAFPVVEGAPAYTPDWKYWTSGWIELVAGALIAVGFLTRPAAFLSSGLMAFAYWMAHAPQGWLPLSDRAGGNGGEAAFVYCFVFFFMSAYGSGAFSVDAYLKKRKAAA